VAAAHAEHGFFMVWHAQLQAGADGFEFHILAMAMAVAVGIRGSGALSLDRRIATARAAGG
jgi:putative oxidoreductase